MRKMDKTQARKEKPVTFAALIAQCDRLRLELTAERDQRICADLFADEFFRECQRLNALLEQALENKEAPAIIPESLVRHGRWIEFETSAYGGTEDGDVKWLSRKFFRCSECRKGSAVRSCYCPNCGAKMDLEDKPC